MTGSPLGTALTAESNLLTFLLQIKTSTPDRYARKKYSSSKGSADRRGGYLTIGTSNKFVGSANNGCVSGAASDVFSC